MKVILWVLMLVPVLVGAKTSLGPDSTWEEIEAAGLQVQIPSVWFGSYSISLAQVCTDGESLRTQGAVRQCVEMSHGPDQHCLRAVTAPLSRPLIHQEKVCRRYAAQHECVEWGVREARLLLDYQIPVREQARSHNGRGDHQGSVVFLKAYSVPDCL